MSILDLIPNAAEYFDDATTDHFVYRATDDVGVSDTATVTIKPAAAIEFTKTVWVAGIEPGCGITNVFDHNDDGLPDYLDPLFPFRERIYLPLITR